MTDGRQNEVLDARLRSVWRRDHVLHRTAGLLAFCGWTLLLFLVGMALDWWLGLPPWGRMVMLVTLVVFASYRAWQGGWRHLRRFDAVRTALRLEKVHGGLDSLLVTAVQLGEAESVRGTSDAMREKTHRDAEEVAAPLRPEEAVSFARLRRLALLALVPVLITAGGSVINGPFVAVGLVRVFAPWLAVEYPTRTRIELQHADRVVKEGADLRVVARISGEVPDSARLVLRTGKGKPRERTLAIVDGSCTYEAETVFRSFDYRIAAGDAVTEWRTVRVIAAPRIVRAEVTLEFPPYTQRPVEMAEALTLTVPEGSRIQWKLALDRAVDSAEYRPAEGTALPLAISPDGRSVTLRQVAAESRAYQFGWVDRDHGFAFSSPRHYLQVEPDRAPSVALTSPTGNLNATLERKLDLAFRGRDDHGIGEATIVYRVNKTEEERVAVPATGLGDGREREIDWDYREALPDLAVGDTVSVAVEVTDLYPGPAGPHRARSEARRVRILSKEDYLAQIEKQKRRLLTQVRSLYREERAVHELVRGLDPSAGAFVQACQLEAVRQDLIRERVGVIRARIDALVEDAAANGVASEASTEGLVALGAELQRVGREHVARAAALLRELAAAGAGEGSGGDPTAAIEGINGAARELGLLVLDLGFAEASDVMARELHATAQTQAALRLRTILQGDGDEALAEAQVHLAGECARLLAATPRNKESNSHDALVAFNLSRLVNGLLRSGADSKMRKSATLVSQGEGEAAARVQADVIAALLHAEFRLRRGAEYEALTKARDLFTTLAAGQEKLREEGSVSTADEFGGNRAAIVRSQSTLLQHLQLLLMPEVPAPRPRLFDIVAPDAPPVDDLLATAEGSMEAARARIESGDRDAAVGHQRQAAVAFARLAEVAGRRMEVLTETERMMATVAALGKQAARLLMLEEGVLAVLEQTEDAAADKVDTAFLVGQSRALVDDAETLRRGIVHWNESRGRSQDDLSPQVEGLARVGRALSDATSLLQSNKPKEAIERQEHALEVVEQATALVEEQEQAVDALASVLATTGDALVPSPLLEEIEAEQSDLIATTKKAKPEELAGLVVPQKNLVHAVDAILTSLDHLAHKIESGTVMLFAKDDMDAAAIGLQTDDIEEALDAQSFVVESLQKLRVKIDDLTPEYRYVLEVIEFLHEGVADGEAIRAGAQRLQEAAAGAPGAVTLRARADESGRQLKRVTGDERHAITARRLGEAIGAGNRGSDVRDVLEVLTGDLADLRTMMKNLSYVIAPPMSLGPNQEPAFAVQLLNGALAVAAHHQDLLRMTRTAAPERLSGFAAVERKLATRCAALLRRRAPSIAGTSPEGVAVPPVLHPHPSLVAAHGHLSEAVAKLDSSDRNAAITHQRQAADALRHFILEFALKHVDVPPPPPPQPPAPSDSVPEDGELQLFLPGALTGTKPKGGRLEWQVLGRRDRAALNENFARELPLEYRAILKDYYERLTR